MGKGVCRSRIRTRDSVINYFQQFWTIGFSAWLFWKADSKAVSSLLLFDHSLHTSMLVGFATFGRGVSYFWRNLALPDQESYFFELCRAAIARSFRRQCLSWGQWRSLDHQSWGHVLFVGTRHCLVDPEIFSRMGTSLGLLGIVIVVVLFHNNKK